MDAAELQGRWRAKYLAARGFMAERAGHPRVLIEVAAQYPLEDGLRPNEEFRARLDRGQELFRRYREEGQFCEIYVPGSRHAFHGRADHVSLSEAGRAYLTDRGVRSGAIHGDDLNVRYRGDNGVYGAADECFVGALLLPGRGVRHAGERLLAGPDDPQDAALHRVRRGAA